MKGRLEVRWPLKGNFVNLLVSSLAKLLAKNSVSLFSFFTRAQESLVNVRIKKGMESTRTHVLTLT